MTIARLPRRLLQILEAVCKRFVSAGFGSRRCLTSRPAVRGAFEPAFSALCRIQYEGARAAPRLPGLVAAARLANLSVT